MELLLAHLLGDYVFQSNWMASRKTKSSVACAVHVACYTAMFALLTPVAWEGLVIIALTHFVIDRWRLAAWWCSFLGVGVRGRVDRSDPMPPPLGPGVAFWLMVIVDNTAHLAINYGAARLFPCAH